MSTGSFDPNQVPKDLVEALQLLKLIRPHLDMLTGGNPRVDTLRERTDILLHRYPRVGEIPR